jgi:hypothetical protein
LIIAWPIGKKEVYKNIKADQYITIVEDEGILH